MVRYYFDRDYGTCGFVSGREDLAKGSFAEDFLDFEFILTIWAVSGRLGLLNQKNMIWMRA